MTVLLVAIYVIGAWITGTFALNEIMRRKPDDRASVPLAALACLMWPVVLLVVALYAVISNLLNPATGQHTA